MDDIKAAGILKSLATAERQDQARTNTAAHYVGSAACEKCHSDIYGRWQKTPMANVVRDPKEHPDAILPDLATNTVAPSPMPHAVADPTPLPTPQPQVLHAQSSRPQLPAADVGLPHVAERQARDHEVPPQAEPRAPWRVPVLVSAVVLVALLVMIALGR